MLTTAKFVRLCVSPGSLCLLKSLPGCSRDFICSPCVLRPPLCVRLMSSNVGKAPITIQHKGFPRVIANPTLFSSLKKSLMNKLRPSVPKIFSLAAVRLYQQCANGIPFLAFIEKYNMKDDLDSWMRITVLHMWLVLLRLSKETQENYLTIRTRMLQLLWEDVEERLRLMPNVKPVQRKRLLESYYGHLVTSLLEYDEGFLGNDMELAGSLYRCFYDTQLSDPVALGNLVRYVRSEAKYLFDLDTGEILACGVPKWKTDENMPDHRTSKKSDYNN